MVTQSSPRLGVIYWQGPGRGLASMFCSWTTRVEDAATYPTRAAAKAAFKTMGAPGEVVPAPAATPNGGQR